MIILNVFFKVKAEQRENFLDLLKNMTQDSKQDFGCQQYRLTQDIVDPLSFVLIEQWENEQALQQHRETPHMNVFSDKIGNYVSEKILIKQYTA